LYLKLGYQATPRNWQREEAYVRLELHTLRFHDVPWVLFGLRSKGDTTDPLNCPKEFFANVNNGIHGLDNYVPSNVLYLPDPQSHLALAAKTPKKVQAAVFKNVYWPKELRSGTLPPSSSSSSSSAAAARAAAAASSSSEEEGASGDSSSEEEVTSGDDGVPSSSPKSAPPPPSSSTGDRLKTIEAMLAADPALEGDVLSLILSSRDRQESGKVDIRTRNNYTQLWVRVSTKQPNSGSERIHVELLPVCESQVCSVNHPLLPRVPDVHVPGYLV
jgi:hypothetical protein